MNFTCGQSSNHQSFLGNVWIRRRSTIRSSLVSTDINECVTNSIACDHMCTNIQGSYLCSCRAGYSLDEDGKSCQGKLTPQIAASQFKLVVNHFTKHRTPTARVVKGISIFPLKKPCLFALRVV